MGIKKFITNNVHFFVIAAILIAGYAIYKTVKSEKAAAEDATTTTTTTTE